MVSEVKSKYPSECYEEYLKKMEKLLIPTDTSRYDGVAYHLSQMREIGLTERFHGYIESVKLKYKKRRRMMEALVRKGL